MALKFYGYTGCGTCRNAKKWLDARRIAYQEIPIRETPPTAAELKRMLKETGGDLRKLFNTSGGDYKAMNLKDSLPGMSENEAIDLLAAHGNLVKRPFVLGSGIALVGFKEEVWEDVLD
ncbi:MAG: Spx/MgsR family RNA polymerase-binding regulatory protein [Candidatus Hydrogenedens sp.]|nr:Spx/MgsR family RNA polymerase-binding regulatory protein [Candidatus Hydrogenedens sp.]